MSEYDPGLHFAKEYAEKWIEDNCEKFREAAIHPDDYSNVLEIIREAIKDAFLAGIKNIMDEIKWEEVKSEDI
ncbi:MAG: hypothetical protein LBC87_03995 [Fibromonadaceae bacterium]|jgi:hypothetical protein|nr:hypothetical protein [Fibromonadaceae bacterium]